MPSPVFTLRAVRGATALALLVAAGGLAGAGCSGPGAGRARDGKGSAAPASRARRVDVPGRGALVLEVPAGWKVETSPGLDPSLPEVIRLEPPGGTAQVILSPMVISEPEDAAEPGETARLFTTMARRKALGTEGEAAAPIQELEGASGRGYWFVATDPTPPPRPDPGAPHAWRHLLRGAVAVGRIVLTFTLLDDRPGPEREALLAMIRAARSAEPAGAAGPGRPGGAAPPDASGEPAEPGALRFEPDPEALTEPLEVVPPGAPFSVLVDLPGFSMFRPRGAEDGEGVLVLGQDPAHGLVASVTVADAAGAADARACRAAKLERIRASAAELHELAEADVGAEAGAAARASYALEELRGRSTGERRQRHAHAFFQRDGACVDVHVSKADPEPEDAARIERILSSVRFGERL